MRWNWCRGFLMGCMVLAMATGCQSTYYKTMEKFGVYKRDLLKKNVQEARNEQEKATEQFKDALTRLKEMYGYQGGDLEKMYDKMKGDFDRSEARAKAVSERVEKVETVAADLFKEWGQEIETISNPKLASNSRNELRETEAKYRELHSAMTRAVSSMEPVLKQFRDQVLYLKHNLNAQAIGALRGETQDIEREIQSLITEMNKSISEADEFIKGMQ